MSWFLIKVFLKKLEEHGLQVEYEKIGDIAVCVDIYGCPIDLDAKLCSIKLKTYVRTIYTRNPKNNNGIIDKEDIYEYRSVCIPIGASSTARPHVRVMLEPDTYCNKMILIDRTIREYRTTKRIQPPKANRMGR